MAKEKTPVTSAVRFLRENRAEFTDHLYQYEEKGGTAASSRELGVDEHCVIKTLVMEDERKEPLLVLMHGDRQVSTKELARLLGKKSIQPCTPEAANKHTGYLVGGTSPFGARRMMPVCLEETILELPRVFLNGGKRGYLVAMTSLELQRLLAPTLVRVAIEKG